MASVEEPSEEAEETEETVEQPEETKESAEEGDRKNESKCYHFSEHFEHPNLSNKLHTIHALRFSVCWVAERFPDVGASFALKFRSS